jgi:hypothetical protein
VHERRRRRNKLAAGATTIIRHLYYKNASDIPRKIGYLNNNPGNHPVAKAVSFLTFKGFQQSSKFFISA